MTRQQRRYEERRVNKMKPGVIARTSSRHIGRTKGTPYSKMKLIKIDPAKDGKPAMFNVKSYTRATSVQKIKATLGNIEWFIKGLPFNMKMAMLG